MPAFQTKTIESILDPVAQQVSRLVILHEDAERFGGLMPDFSSFVAGVQSAVENLVKVGLETIDASDDVILQQDMPTALRRIQEASDQLVESAQACAQDPRSPTGRTLLIAGSRGILKATTLLLTTFDDSEVRRIVRACKKVFEFIQVVEVLDSVADLVEFVKNLSPALAEMTREVSQRTDILTHRERQQLLRRSLETVKSQTPNLVTAVKTFISTRERGHGIAEAAANREALATSISKAIVAIMTILQANPLGADDTWDYSDPGTCRRMAFAFNSQMRQAHDFLIEPASTPGCMGERSLNNMLGVAEAFASHYGYNTDRLDGDSRTVISKGIKDIRAMVDSMNELRNANKGATPQAQALGRNAEDKLKEIGRVMTGVADLLSDGPHPQRPGLSSPATSSWQNLGTPLQHLPTIMVRLDRCHRLLGANQSLVEAAELAISSATELAQEFAALPPGHKAVTLFGELAGTVHTLGQAGSNLNREVREAAQRGQALSPAGRNAFQSTYSLSAQILGELQRLLAAALVENFSDTATLAYQLVAVSLDASSAPSSDRVAAFTTASNTFATQSTDIVALGGLLGKLAYTEDRLILDRLSDATVLCSSTAVQLSRAALIAFDNAGDRTAAENARLASIQWNNAVAALRAVADDLIDTIMFMRLAEVACTEDAGQAEALLSTGNVEGFKIRVGRLGRRATRIVEVARHEAQNCDDDTFVTAVGVASDALASAITDMVQSVGPACDNVVGASSAAGQNAWRNSKQLVLSTISSVRNVFEDYVANFVAASESGVVPRHPRQHLEVTEIHDSQNGDQQDVNNGVEHGEAPGSRVSSRPGTAMSSEFDDDPETSEAKQMFARPDMYQSGGQPILKAAYDLHLEASQWSSRENDLVAAAKRMALLMAKFNQLILIDGSRRRDFITVAKSIADQADVITQLAADLAHHCSDRRMRDMLLRAAEPLPTIANQFKILSTVKATMMGATLTDEDQEAAETLVGNAQNLMASVRHTVRCAEACSIRIRIDSGVRIRWIRRNRPVQYFATGGSPVATAPIV